MSWIKITDEVPHYSQRVLCYNGYVYVKEFVQIHDCDVFYDGITHWNGYHVGKIEDVTHWMPLPEPPENS